MTEITLEKTHALLEKLSEYVMRELPTRREVDNKVDKLAEYVMNEVALKNDVPTKNDFNAAIRTIQTALDQKADKKDVDEIKHDLQIIMNGMDKQGQQYYTHGAGCFNDAFGRLEKRVGTDALKEM